MIAEYSVSEKYSKWLIKILFIDLALSNITQLLVLFPGFDILRSFFKIFCIIEVGIMFTYFLLRRKFRTNLLGCIFILFFFIGIIWGILNGNFTSAFISHIYEYLMPVIVMCFADAFLDTIINNVEIKTTFIKYVRYTAILYIICVIIFRILYTTGLLTYAAYGAGCLIFVLPILLFYTEDLKLAYLLIVAGALSGKRIILIQAVVIYAVYVLFKRKRQKSKIKNFSFIGIAIVAAVYLLNNTTFFTRILWKINGLFGEEQNLYIATGGRNTEFEVILPILNADPISWILGKGFGVQVYISGVYRHYAHFTPLGYVLVSGLLFTIFLYAFLVFEMVSLLMKKDYISRMLGCYIGIIIISSFTGAILFNEQKYWLVIGCAISWLHNKQISTEDLVT